MILWLIRIVYFFYIDIYYLCLYFNYYNYEYFNFYFNRVDVKNYLLFEVKVVLEVVIIIIF